MLGIRQYHRPESIEEALRLLARPGIKTVALAGGQKVFNLVCASIAFGLVHFLWGPWGMLGTTILGFTFGLVVLWRGNVWAAVVAHTLLNLCIEPGLIEKALTLGFNQ